MCVVFKRYTVLCCKFYDRFGRKKSVWITGTLLAISSAASALSPSYEVYCIIRIFAGGSSIAMYIAMFIYGR